MKEKDKSRRNFIKMASLAALGLSTSSAAMVKLKAMNALLAPPPPYTGFGNYKALVFVFLHGGNDSFNMLVPKTGVEYGEYAATRTNLAIPQGDLLGINADTLGLHPSLTDVHSMYTSGDLGLIANIGTMLEPTTLTQY